MATQRQTWALFCGTGLDCREINVSVEAASDLISRMKAGESIVDELISLGATGKPKAPKQDFDKIWAEAHANGIIKAAECTPTPMVVEEHANPLDDNSPVVKTYAPVMDGVCGFAWVGGINGTTSFAKWAKAKKLANKSYYGGVQIWVSLFGQSMQRKEAYAYGVAEVLNKHGIKCNVGSRMD